MASEIAVRSNSRAVFHYLTAYAKYILHFNAVAACLPVLPSLSGRRYLFLTNNADNKGYDPPKVILKKLLQTLR